jgi:hypothetical protein
MSKKPQSLRLLRKAAIVFAVRVCLALVTLVFAASISVSPITYQAEIGSYVNVANNLVATDRGFSVASAGSIAVGTVCAHPVQFSSSPSTANTTITAGHWIFSVQVNSTTGIFANANYTVALTLASAPYAPLCIEGASAPANNDVITCNFDVGSTLPTSPYTFKVTIQ